MNFGIPNFKRAFLDTPDGQVHYCTAGAGEPLLLFHQTPFSIQAYAELMPIFAKRRLVIAMDNPGYGDSDMPPRLYSTEDYTKTAISLMDSLKVEKATLLGHHTGAFIAIDLATTYPERVDKLIVSFPLPLLNDEERKLGLEAIISYFERYKIKLDGSHLMEAWRSFSGRSVPPDLTNRLVLDLLKSSARGWLGAFAYHAIFSYPMEERLPLIQCPTLIIWGMRDLENHDKIFGLHTLENRHRVKESIARSKVVEFEGPHSTYLDINLMADEFGQAVLDFMEARDV